MEHIRPHQIFAMIGAHERAFTGALPRPIGGSVTALEACLLVAVLRAVKPVRAFEFGTYLGDTTRLLAENLGKPDGIVYTLDIATTEGIEFENEADPVLADRSVAADRSFTGLTAEVTQLLGDSYEFDPSPYEGMVGIVFIDGNHAPKYLEKDTANALRMVAAEGPAAVVWHDYGNPQCPEVAQYLDLLSTSMALCHIEETMLVLHLRDVTLPGRQST